MPRLRERDRSAEIIGELTQAEIVLAQEIQAEILDWFGDIGEDQVYCTNLEAEV
jgi:hypothetical protein